MDRVSVSLRYFSFHISLCDRKVLTNAINACSVDCWARLLDAVARDALRVDRVVEAEAGRVRFFCCAAAGLRR